MKRALVVLAGLVAFSGCTKTTQQNESSQEIRVGEFGSLTGNEATFGQSTHKGIVLAIDEVNAKGGIKGKKIKLINEDNRGSSDESITVVKKLITKDKVIAVLGEVASSRSIAVAPIAQSYKIPMISPSSTNPELTKKGDYVFRVCFIDPFQGLVMAKFAYDNLKARKVAVLKEISSAYSMGLAQFFVEKFKSLGGEIVEEAVFQTEDTDFKAQLTKIKAKNPDAIFLPAYYTQVGLIARQAKQMGIKVPLLGGDGWESPKLVEIAKDSLNGSYYSNHYSTEASDPATQEFIKKFKERYNETPDSMAALGYDAAKVLMEAMARTTELTPENLRNEIAKTAKFQGATGLISLNADRNADKSAVVLQVEPGNKLKHVATIAP